MKWYLCVALIVVITASSGFCGNWHKRYDYDSAGEDDSGSDEHWHHHFEDDEGSDGEEDQFGQDQDKFEQNGPGQLGKKGQGQPEQNGQEQPEQNGQEQPEQNGQEQPEQEGQGQQEQTGQDQGEQNGQEQAEQDGQGQSEQNAQGQFRQNARGQGTPARKNQQSGSSSQNGAVQLSIPQQPRGQADDTLKQCLTGCRVTTEFNPVCGSDNITYSNPGRLECAKSCGVDVSVLRTSSCSVPPLIPSTDSTFNKIDKSSTPVLNVATEASAIDSAISLSNENSPSFPIDDASTSSGSAGLGTSTPVALSSASSDVSNSTDIGSQSQTGSAVETSPVSIAVDGTAIQLSANTDAPVASTDSPAVNLDALNSSLINPTRLNAIFTNTPSTLSING